MKNSQRLSQARNFIVLFETIVLTTSVFGIGYILTPEDPYAFHSEHAFGILFLTIITLYYGSFIGLFSLTLIAISAYFLYETLPYKEILESMLFVLIFGEFHFFWHRSIVQAEEKQHYTQQRLRELGNAFFALKLSHDQLETGYMLQPVTLRSLIAELNIEQAAFRNIYSGLLDNLNKAFQIDQASYYHLDKDHNATLMSSIGEEKVLFNNQHPLIANSLQKKLPSFVSDYDINISKNLIVAIPVIDLKNRIVGMLLIGHMPFMSFNQDTFLKIEIILDYFEQEQQKYSRIENAQLAFPTIDNEFASEMIRLQRLKEKFNVDSTVFAIYAYDLGTQLQLKEFVDEAMRLLDIGTVVIENALPFYIFLLPLEKKSGVFSFQNRLIERVGFKEEKKQSIYLGIEDIDKVVSWIESQSRL
jgi:polysaccharide biosynthesis protein PelD